MEENEVFDYHEVRAQYPSLIHRVKAAFIDVFVILLGAYGFSDLFVYLGGVPDNIRLMSFIFLFGFYEPLGICFFGNTIGQNSIGICVRRESNEKKKITIISALLRYALKILLSWVSFLTMGKNLKKKALHDMVVGSVVVFAKK